MAQTVFVTEYNTFCRDFLIADGRPAPSMGMFEAELGKQEAALFEKLMLFERVALKVYGENIPAALLYNRLGERGLEALLEQRAIEFVLWPQTITYLVDNIPGVDAIVIGELTSATHCDPEASAEDGLNRLTNKLPRGKKRRLIRKLAEAYRTPPKGLAAKSWKVVNGALKAGQLRGFGFPEELERAERIDNLTIQQKQHLAASTETVLEYEFLMRAGMTSFGRYDLYSPFWASAQRFQMASASRGGFAELARLEQIPDLKTLYTRTPDLLKKIPDLRHTRNARLFRAWLENTAGGTPDMEFVKAYVDAIANRRGFFDSNSGKLARTITMAVVGMGLGSVAGSAGAVLGAVAAPLAAEFLASTSLGLVDTMLIEHLARGWSPRMFIDDLREFESDARQK